MLGVYVGVMVGVDVMTLVVYTAVEGARGNLEPQRISNLENTEDIEEVRGWSFGILYDSGVYN